MMGSCSLYTSACFLHHFLTLATVSEGAYFRHPPGALRSTGFREPFFTIDGGAGSRTDWRAQLRTGLPFEEEEEGLTGNGAQRMVGSRRLVGGSMGSGAGSERRGMVSA